MKHTYDPTEWEAKKQAKTDLEKPHAAPNSVKDLRERVNKIERALNIAPSEQ